MQLACEYSLLSSHPVTRGFHASQVTGSEERQLYSQAGYAEGKLKQIDSSNGFFKRAKELYPTRVNFRQIPFKLVNCTNFKALVGFCLTRERQKLIKTVEASIYLIITTTSTFFYEGKIEIGTENIFRVDISTQLWSKIAWISWCLYNSLYICNSDHKTLLYGTALGEWNLFSLIFGGHIVALILLIIMLKLLCLPLQSATFSGSSRDLWLWLSFPFFTTSNACQLWVCQFFGWEVNTDVMVVVS